MPSFKRKRIPEYQGTGKKFKAASRTTVSNLTRKVNKILSEQERKNFDVVATNVALAATTASVVQLSSISQGDDATTRDGRKVALVSSQMRYTINGATSSMLGGFRVIVLIDKQANGVSAAAGDILTAPTNIRSPLTMDFKERFRVIHDNYSAFHKGDYPLSFALNVSEPTAALVPGQYFYKVPEDLAQVEFGGIGNIPISGAVVMLLLSEQAATISYYHRLRFTDS